MRDYPARILVHGHRGARGARPENTLEAFEYAIAVGADALELDVAVTHDNVLVVSHDPVLPQAGGVIREMTWAKLNGRLPALREVFRLAVPAGVDLNLELKSFPNVPRYAPEPHEFAGLLLAVVRDFGMAARVMVQSFDFRILRAMRAMAPEIRRGALFENDFRNFVSIGKAAGSVHYVAPHYPLITPDQVRQAHAAGMQVVPWTVNGVLDWERMAAAGVDAMITDDPAGLIAWLRSR